MIVYPLLGISYYISNYFPEEMDPSLKPKDSAGCKSCRNIDFDFIIVGAGSAGCVVANRLSANPNWKVLLIEAGGDENYYTDTPAADFYMLASTNIWPSWTVKQPNACQLLGGVCMYRTGRVMGGSSTINGMAYARGTAQDYEDWEKMGNTGWSYKDVLPYFLKMENMTIPELAKDTKHHSIGGPIPVGYSKYFSPYYKDVIQAGIELGYPEVDYNGKEQSGISRTQLNVKGPTRCSTSKAYLDPIRTRKNLYIFKNTLVTKVLLNNETRNAVGVTCITNGEEYNVTASKEVIISAGAVNTPKLLMLSGVGPREHLEEMKIPVYADLPVGKHLVDHPGVWIPFISDNNSLPNGRYFSSRSMLKYAKYKKGPLTTSTHEVLVFMKRPNSSNTEAQILFGLGSVNLIATELKFAYFYATNLVPISEGIIKLKSSSITDETFIDTNTLNDFKDMDLLKWAVKEALKFLETKSLRKYSLNWIAKFLPKCSKFPYLSEDFLDCAISQLAMPSLHPVGTAKMGPKSDKTAVVDQNLLVHSTHNLRVVDASVMPKIPRANTNAPTIMIAEKASDIIRSFHENRSLTMA